MATQRKGERLATLPTYREQIKVRTAPLSARLSERRRVIAFCDLFKNAVRKPETIYELQRSHPRTQLPGERERTLIHEGIASGAITREQIVAYRTSQLMDDLSVFPGSMAAEEATYCALMREVGEAVEWLTVAKGIPTPENTERAACESREAAVLLEMHATNMNRGTAA